MGLKRTVAPAVEPVTLLEAKDFARVDELDDDALVTSLIVAARERVELVTRRALVTQTWALKLDAFPQSVGNGWWACGGRNAREDAIVLPVPPLQSVTSIAYVDAAGDARVMDPADYVVDATSEPGRITLADGACWPATACVANAVTVTFVAGYGAAAAVPASARTFVKMAVAKMYDGDVDGVGALEVLLGPLLWGSYA